MGVRQCMKDASHIRTLFLSGTLLRQSRSSVLHALKKQHTDVSLYFSSLTMNSCFFLVTITSYSSSE